MTQAQNSMRTKPPLSLLLSMSLPVMLSMLIQSLYNIVDSLWVARLGTDAITAVSLAVPLQNIVLSLGVGMGVGIGALLSMHLGSGNREKASITASTGMMLVGIHCVVFFLGGIFITKPFLSLFTDDPQTLLWACDYTRIVLCLSFGQLIQMGLAKIFQSAGRMMVTMWMVLTGCILNIILDPILIFGLLGFPALGIRGAAIATVIGQIVPLFLYVLLYVRQDLGLSLSPRYVRWNGALIRQIYLVGIPSTLVLAMPSLLTALLNGILVKLGSVYVAVFGLWFKLQTFVNMPAGGVIQGMRPIIGYNYGAGETGRVRAIIRYSTTIVGAIVALGTMLALFFPEQILRMFEADSALTEAGIPALRILSMGLLLSTLSVVACGVFEALGRGRVSLRISLLRQLVILVPLGWLLSRFLGALGIWLAFPIAEAAALIPSAWMLRRLIRTELS